MGDYAWMFAKPVKIGELDVSAIRTLHDARHAFTNLIASQERDNIRKYDDSFRLAYYGIDHVQTATEFIEFASQHVELVGEFHKSFFENSGRVGGW